MHPERSFFWNFPYVLPVKIVHQQANDIAHNSTRAVR
jgi:hypothetical protein